MHNPFLVGEKVYLRTIEKSDINENYQSWFNDPDVCKFNDHHRFPMYRERMNDYYETVIKTKENLVLAVVDRETDTHIGNIALQNIDIINRSAELAIIIGEKNVWGKGFATDAAVLIVGHGFSSLNLHRIYCGTSSANIGMQRLAEKIGFKKIGVRREAIYKEGEYHDIVEYDLLEHEYE